MSCPCESSTPGTPAESVASQLSNLVAALFGQVEKTVVNGRTVWGQTCPTSLPFNIYGVTPFDGEGTLCYIIRALKAVPGVETLDLKLFADTAERHLAVPGYASQLGVQADNGQLYLATGLEAGDWALYQPAGLTQVFDNSAALSAASPAFVGQIGLRKDTAKLYWGTATTPGSWSATVPAASEIVSSMIADAAVTAAKIADLAVATAKIADAAVTTAKIADAAVTASKLASAAVTSDKLANGAVTLAKLADAVVPNDTVLLFPSCNTGARSHLNLPGGTVFLDNYKRVRVAGANTTGQLGLGAYLGAGNAGGFSVVHVPFAVAGEYVTKIFVGAQNIFLLSSSGNLYGCGDCTTHGILGNGVTTSPVFVQVPLPYSVSDFAISKATATAESFALAVLSDGSLRAWGLNGAYQLGDNSTTTRTSPVVVSMPAGKTAKRVYAFGGGGYGSAFVIDTNNEVFCCGYNYVGQLGIGSTATQQTFTSTGRQASAVFGSAFGTTTSPASVYLLKGVEPGGVTVAGYTPDGFLYGAGDNTNGILGVGDTSVHTSFTKVPNLAEVEQVFMSCGNSAGSSVAAITTAATGNKLYVWGRNANGQLGVASTSPVISPVQPTGHSARAFKKVQFAGSDTNLPVMLALDTSGQMYAAGVCAGTATSGRCLGTGSYSGSSSLAPVLQHGVLFSDFYAFGSGDNWCVLACTAAGELYAWGDNTNLQLGVGTGTSVTQPQKVKL